MASTSNSNFADMTQVHDLGDGSRFFVGRLPGNLIWDTRFFERVWRLHPIERHWVKMLGKPIQVARWQQAFGADYQYSGSWNNAMHIPIELRPTLEWAQRTINSQLNGLLLNWYDGANDYIGPHHDSTTGLIQDSPIVTISFGETRIFRLSFGTGATRALRDFSAIDGAVFVMPWATNKSWKHEVLKRANYSGRRISVTIRAFSEGVLQDTGPKMS